MTELLKLKDKYPTFIEFDQLAKELKSQKENYDIMTNITVHLNDINSKKSLTPIQYVEPKEYFEPYLESLNYYWKHSYLYINKLWLYMTKTFTHDEITQFINTQSDKNWFYSGEIKPKDFEVVKRTCSFVTHELYELLCEYNIFDTNFKPVFQTMEFIVNNGGMSFQFIKDLIIQNQTTYQKYLTSTESRIKNLCQKLNANIELESQIKLGNMSFDDVMCFIKSDKWNQLYLDEQSKLCMQTMADAINDTPGAEEWFVSDGKINSKHPMLDILSAHPKVEAVGHSGLTMSWTLSQFRCIYQKGWCVLIKSVIITRGICWDLLTIMDALDIKNQRCAIWMFNRDNFTIEQTKAFTLFAIFNNMDEFLTVLFDSTQEPLLPLSELAVLTWKYDNQNEIQLCHILKDYWEKKYTRCVDISNIDLYKFIQDVWDILPYDEYFKTLYSEKNHKPTRQEINNKLKDTQWLWDINNKCFSIKLDNLDKFDPYYLDKTIGKYGAIAGIIRNYKERAMDIDKKNNT